MEKIPTEDVRAYLGEKVPAFASAVDAKEIVALCREAANRFGLYNTLQAICDELNLEQSNDSTPLVGADAQNAIDRVEALRG